MTEKTSPAPAPDIATALRALLSVQGVDDVAPDEAARKARDGDAFWVAIQQARAALSAATPAPVGYVLVPVEPTPEMRSAADMLPDSFSIGDEWRAMLAAAPKPVAPVATDAKPVMWMARAENGNIRCWTSAEDEALRLAREIGFELTPLYTAPQAPQQARWCQHCGETTVPGLCRAPKQQAEPNVEAVIGEYARAAWHHDTAAMEAGYVRLRALIKPPGMTDAIQQAVAAERERCATLCDAYSDPRDGDYAAADTRRVAAALARAIRSDSDTQVTGSGHD